MRAFRRRTGALALALCMGFSAALMAPGAVSAGVVKRSARQSSAAAVQESTAGNTALSSGNTGRVVDTSLVSVDGGAKEETRPAALDQETKDAVAATTAVGESQAAVAAAGSRGTEAKVVMSSLFGGDELMMVAPRTVGQQMSFIITTKNGSLIVIDGGVPGDAPHMKQLLQQKGGHVAAWFISHPHSDHVGALTAILNDTESGITIDNVYYHFTTQDWYEANEAYRADVVRQCTEALSKLSPAARHPQVHKGEQIQIDDVKITVLNDPYFFQTNAINNSTVVYRMEMGGKRLLFLGDLGVEGGNRLLNEYRNNPGELRADIVQMAHHGQSGVDRNVYEVVRPTICLWCAPAWLWNNDNGGGVNSGNWKTLEVRNWMRQLGAKTHVVAKDGDQVLR